MFQSVMETNVRPDWNHKERPIASFSSTQRSRVRQRDRHTPLWEHTLLEMLWGAPRNLKKEA